MQSAEIKKIVYNYASVMFDLGRESNASDEIYKNLQDIQKVFENTPDLARVLKNPLVEVEDLQNVITAILNKISAHDIVKKVFEFIIKNKRASLINDVIATYNDINRKNNNVVRVLIVSAQSLDDKAQQNIHDNIKEALKSDIDISFQYDDSLIGGYKMLLDDNYMIDASIQYKIMNLKNQIKDTINNAI